MKLCRLCKVDKMSGAEGEDANFFLDPSPRFKYVCTECRMVYKGTKVRHIPVAEDIVQVPRLPAPGNDRGQLLDVAVELRTKNYQEPALQAIYELAVMPVSANPNLMNIKMAAARLLVGPMPWEQGQGQPVGDNPGSLLASLNEAYHTHAVRIKNIRERTITFSDDKDDKVIN